MFSFDWLIALIVLASGFLAYEGWLLGARVQTYCCRKYSMLGAGCGFVIASTVLLIAIDPKALHESGHFLFWPVLSFWLAFVVSALAVIVRWGKAAGRETMIANSVIFSAHTLLAMNPQAVFTSDAFPKDVEESVGPDGYSRREIAVFMRAFLQACGTRRADGIYEMTAEKGFAAHAFAQKRYPGWI